MVRDYLAATTGAGAHPDEIVDPVLEAIRTGTFLIPTQPSYLQQLGIRFDQLSARQLPTNPTPTDDRRRSVLRLGG